MVFAPSALYQATCSFGEALVYIPGAANPLGPQLKSMQNASILVSPGCAFAADAATT
jgi:hypothetical protein